MEQTIYLKEDGFSPEKCTAELESPVSTDYVRVRINGNSHGYCNIEKKSLRDVVDIMLLKKKTEDVVRELEDELDRLNKLLEKPQNQPKFKPFNSDNFTKIIGEQAQKTAQLSHELEMKRIKSKLIADLCLELAKTPISFGDVAHWALVIADAALKDI